MVINYDVPRDCDDYIHRVGRTARAGNEGRAVTFVSVEDQIFFKRIEDFIEQSIEKMPIPKTLGEVPEYAPKKEDKKEKRRNNYSRNKKDNRGNSNSTKKKNTAQQHPQNSRRDKKRGKSNHSHANGQQPKN